MKMEYRRKEAIKVYSTSDNIEFDQKNLIDNRS